MRLTYLELDQARDAITVLYLQELTEAVEPQDFLRCVGESLLDILPVFRATSVTVIAVAPWCVSALGVR